jgi:hypothetical protein
VTGALFAGLEVDSHMAELARELARRNGWTFLGVVQAAGLVAPVPMAQLRDAHGALHQRTIEDLRAERRGPERGERRAPVDGRTLSLF